MRNKISNFVVFALVIVGSFRSSLQAETARQFLSDALVTSPQLSRQRIRVRAAELEEKLFLSELDPYFGAGYLYSDDQSPRAAPLFEGPRSRAENVEASISQKTLIGTQAKLLWQNTRLQNPASFRVLDPSAESILSLQLDQPLLRYFYGRPDKVRRSRFQFNVLVAKEQLAQDESDILLANLQALLEYQLASERVRMAEAAVRNSQSLVEKYTEKKKYGLIEPSDLVQANVSVEADNVDLELARTDLAKMRAILEDKVARSVLQIDELKNDFLNSLHFPKTIEESVALAQGERADMKQALAAEKSTELGLRSEVLDTLPELSLRLGYGFAGLDSNYSKAWDDLGSFDHTVRSAGLNLSIPFGAKKEKLLRESKRLAMNVQSENVRELKTRIELDVKNAWTDREWSEKRFKARETLFELQRKKYKAENDNFERGRSTTDVLVRFQQDINRAELEFVRSKMDLISSQARLAHSMGLLTPRLLEAHR